MWKKVNGRLIHTTDETREKFRTSISRTLLSDLEQIAKENNTYVNYLLENGMKNLLKAKDIAFDKNTRPKDRIRYQTTYDKHTLEEIKELAREHKLYVNDLIEYSAKYINPEEVNDIHYRYRIERAGDF